MDRQELARLHDLTGRVAIVTGGTRGIGRSIAEGLVAAGARVAVASRKPEACAETEAHLRALGGEAIGIPTHMGSIDAVNALVDCTVEEFGQLDIIVNNAATALTQPFGELTVDAWEKSLGTNLRGPVFLIERALPHLEASDHAAILNVISAGVYLFSPHTAMYAAGKAGLMAMTLPLGRALLEERAQPFVHVLTLRLCTRAPTTRARSRRSTATSSLTCRPRGGRASAACPWHRAGTARRGARCERAP